MTPTINTENTKNKQNKFELLKWFSNPDTSKIIRTNYVVQINLEKPLLLV